ncbi:hypothetical protein BDV33DRAFT_183090, partial [Aspergillus novoparasiticus]
MPTIIWNTRKMPLHCTTNKSTFPYSNFLLCLKARVRGLKLALCVCGCVFPFFLFPWGAKLCYHILF